MTTRSEAADLKPVEKLVEVVQSDTPDLKPLSTVLWEARKILFYSLCCCIGSMLWGFDVGVNTITIALPAFKMVFGYEYKGELLIDAKWNALWTAMTSIGMILGGVICGTLSDHWGRKAGMLLGSILSIVGVAVQYTSESAGALLAGKIVNGFAMGFFLSTGPIYVSEIAPIRIRSALIATTSFFISAGQMAAIGIGNTRYAIMNPSAYKVVFASQWAFPGAILLFLLILPESPRYLVRKNRLEAAERSLRALHTPQHNISAAISTLHQEILAEATETTMPSTSVHQKSASYLDCFRGTNWRRTRIACSMFLIQQFSGIALYAQALYFLGISGFNVQLSFQLALGGFGAGLLGNVLSWLAMGYIGRRPMLFTGTLINLAILLTVGVAGVFSTRKAAMLYIAIMINFVQLIYAPTIGAVSWSISGEISSVALRAKTQSLCTLTNAVANWLFNFITPYLINSDQANLGAKAAFVWAALTAIAAVWVWLEVPETKDLSFAELDRAFRDRLPTRRFPRAERGLSERA
ncbi:general substrate transporter [Aspergillus terricola var. indicus]